MSKSIILKIAAAVCIVALLACAFTIFGKTFRIGNRYANAEQYTAGATTLDKPVKNLDVNWTDGRVTIAYHDKDTVEIAETAKKEISADAQLRWWLDGDTLRIQYAKSGYFRLTGLNKELTLTLPEGIGLGSVAIDATSAEVDAPDLRADDIAVDMTSGSLALSQLGKADRVRIDVTSGDIRAALENVKDVSAELTSGRIEISQTGEAESVDISTTSGNVTLACDAARRASVDTTSGKIDVSLAAFDALKIESTSGNVTAALPTEPGFKADIDTTSGSFDSAIPLTQEKSSYTCGDASASVDIDTTSGNVRLVEYGK